MNMLLADEMPLIDYHRDEASLDLDKVALQIIYNLFSLRHGETPLRGWARQLDVSVGTSGDLSIISIDRQPVGKLLPVMGRLSSAFTIGDAVFAFMVGLHHGETPP
jgi:hypothetical protein